MPLGKKVRKQAARSPFEIVIKNAFTMGVDVQVIVMSYVRAKFAAGRVRRGDRCRTWTHPPARLRDSFLVGGGRVWIILE